MARVKVLFAAIVLTGAVESLSARMGSDLTGNFVYEGGKERDRVTIDLTVVAEARNKFSIEIAAAHPDAHGAAPDGAGEGQIDRDGVLHFKYEDSFSNKGAGTFERMKDGYLLSIDIKEVQDSRCLTFYGKHILQRKPSGK